MTDAAAEQSTTAKTPTDPSAEIIARRGFWFTLQRCIGIPVMCICFGGWFLYDGFVAYPASNQRIVDLGEKARQAKDAGDALSEAKLLNERKLIEPHDELGILIQKVLGFSLTPLGIVLGAYFLHRSRGSYRLADETLYIPGHPPVPLSAVTAIDMTRFDKKGIVRVTYELPGSAAGGFTLDDFVYDQDPTDAIIKRIEKSLAPAEATEVVAEESGVPEQTERSAENESAQQAVE